VAVKRGVDAISALWLGLLVGRLAFLGWRGPVDARVLVLCGTAAAVLLGGGVALDLHGVEWVVGATGVALGPVFPVMIALTAIITGLGAYQATFYFKYRSL